MAVEKYLKPSVINQIKRLDLRAQFVVKGFLHGLHASPFHGFSVEFSEHRKYSQGDDLKDIDWQVYAKTDKYYVCLLYTSPSPRDRQKSRMPSSA